MPNVKGARRKTTAQLALSGELQRRPGRYANVGLEPQPTGPLGNPPAHFDKQHRAAWKEIAANCSPGVLTNSDRIHVEQLCCLLCLVRGGNGKASDMSLLMASLQQCGMTPLARSRVAIPAPAKADNSWAALLNPASATKQ